MVLRIFLQIIDDDSADYRGVFALSNVVVTRTFRNYAKMEEMIS